MATNKSLDDLISLKLERLESVPAIYETNLIKVQKQLLKNVSEILTLFDVDNDGFYLPNKKNADLLEILDIKLREALSNTDYIDATITFANEFNTQIIFNDDYFKIAFQNFTTSELGKQFVLQAQKNAVDILVKTVAESEYVYPVKQQIENAIINGARGIETLKNLKEFITGFTDREGNFKEGRLLAHSKQIAHDSFAVADRSYASTVAKEVGATWFKYSGRVIETSRPFCVERHNLFFCINEIELWGDGVATGDFETPQGGKQPLTINGKLYLSGGTWAGMMKGTDAQTIFSTAGGYNCGHSIMAYSIYAVPLKQVQRAVDLGLYKPTSYEIKRLGLKI